MREVIISERCVAHGRANVSNEQHEANPQSKGRNAGSRSKAATAICMMLCAAIAGPAVAATAGSDAATKRGGGVSSAHATAAAPGSTAANGPAGAAAPAPGSASSPADAAAYAASAASAAAAAAATAAASAAVAAAAQHAADVAAHLDPRDALKLADQFSSAVTRRLSVPPADQRAYGQRLQAALAANGLGALSRQYVVLVDRNPNVQALFIYFRGDPASAWTLIGAAPVATGLPGRYDHFVTPLGVFEHTPQNMDFRAEGTVNENGIRGYGARDMRIFDFGWTDAERGWGKGGVSSMRFQMHATDPDKLEPLLGIRHSKGCVRIPASLDRFLDEYGVIDAGYQAMIDAGFSLWVLHRDRTVTPWAGRYLAVVDSDAKSRPVWSREPRPEVKARVPEGADTAD
ncbi:L,D-transpeptidase [Trinickia sp.]|uniref:L,D-transpeptidase n=1 Tax=Trinickia sp. TaxID=2571163 RepID=UPI003F802E19